MYIPDLSTFVQWLSGAELPSSEAITIAPPVVEQLARVAAMVQANTLADTNLRAAGLLLGMVAEHARQGERSAAFARWLGAAAPERLAGLCAVLAFFDGRQQAAAVLESALRRAAGSGRPIELDLINSTLAHAGARSRRYAAFPVAVDSLEEFSQLPILTRADVDHDLPGICAKDVPTDFFTATSATTTGHSLLVPHCRAEHAALPEARTSSEPRSPLGMTLRLMPAGRLIGAPVGSPDTILATYETNAARENVWDLWDYIAGQVFAELPSADGKAPIETIHATPAFGLILLTKYMMQRGIDPRLSAVRTLIATGSWIGPSTRRWLEKSWGAHLHVPYSCSELVGGAAECPERPGRYHFGESILPEVLDATGHPARDGEEGEIHMTGLYPFQRSASFIRYQVGDWGRACGSAGCGCAAKGYSLELLGRTRDVVFVTTSDGTRLPISPVPMRNALDRFAFIPKIPRPQYKLKVVEGSHPELKVDVECYFLANAAWYRQAVDDIGTAILEEDDVIRALESSGALRLSIKLHSRSKLTQMTSVI